MEPKKLITVTSPLLPDLEEFNELLKDIWNRKWITNNGHYHQELEKALCEYLKVPYISLFTNGTLPLITALQALRITGEVITTPYSFVATTHSLWWNGIKPVFVDIDPHTNYFSLDQAKQFSSSLQGTNTGIGIQFYQQDFEHFLTLQTCILDVHPGYSKSNKKDFLEIYH